MVFLGGYVGAVACCSKYTGDYGSVFADNWVGCFVIGVFLDLLGFETAIWLVYLLNENSTVGNAIRMIKNLKVA